ncbi:hypothetical protein A2331_03490 [Candidatus Falkowbacteria bacterium RIFOXYB2_FULL_34_18]|uniref:Uncharacterized protein n=1 Tax=Candidatus Falkowbacteria bacterium RIFOXYD2_FULL_34_120 TaxID=1798007 RepID=A0A1F5TSD9_9BACT|nr:MAG: hypothetical protein A2331_03490 [Candidatus Falkowbacteria bacterium RIFOXYB2_FULL_34_18]OGF30114.1 MAG: hypothetical protein A2500_04960 [Candidatus Falkowbacteria bacterium RIFOXYC12_FULL_34_55]OGF37552.1 MAG: hypothetical protein A2466_01885 [Candidatus Falkowbacteria bacterium RIFOXYC2_FULL_34_220]OGF39308.1 MAG: hypothetical protein A2515_02300 [Candidatus Falkowbacteria bacterium RIFOXYD12_FULL_34_57]OGF41813.1 MAG: hypothetical protein A2531_05285 [Candidatus Falkowbacteria bact
MFGYVPIFLDKEIIEMMDKPSFIFVLIGYAFVSFILFLISFAIPDVMLRWVIIFCSLTFLFSVFRMIKVKINIMEKDKNE